MNRPLFPTTLSFPSYDMGSRSGQGLISTPRKIIQQTYIFRLISAVFREALERKTQHWLITL